MALLRLLLYINTRWRYCTIFFNQSGAGSVCRNTQSSSQVFVDQSLGAMWIRALQESDPAAEAKTPTKGFLCWGGTGRSVVEALEAVPSWGAHLWCDSTSEQQLSTFTTLYVSSLPLCCGSAAGLSRPICARPPARLGLHRRFLPSHDRRLSLVAAGELYPGNAAACSRICRWQSPCCCPQHPLLQSEDERHSNRTGDVYNEDIYHSEPKRRVLTVSPTSAGRSEEVSGSH